MEVTPGGIAIAVSGAPKECTLWTSGIYQGLYEDKYNYSADFSGQQYGSTPGPRRVWGWSSVGREVSTLACGMSTRARSIVTAAQLSGN